MPLWHSWHTCNDAFVYSWLISEDESYFLYHLQDAPLDWHYLNNIRNKEKRLEWLASRLLLWQKSNAIPYKDEYGKPFVIGAERNAISITHTRHLVAIIISNHACGIDAEWVDSRARKIMNKFMTPNELHQFQMADDTHISALWSIKEAVYKLNGKPNIIFKENIEVEHFTIKENKATCQGRMDNARIGLFLPFSAEICLLDEPMYNKKYIIVTVENVV
ncbi:MAG: 4'-phosphopantetheinyl transferase superfamily protein [Saprospiraceae bacterium]|nr:4'-phosphopantetheinyl transferase superfamily protein [Saprospiraceae bacterium]